MTDLDAKIFIDYNNSTTVKEMAFITTEGLAELKNYQYKSGGYTWIDGKMNYFWQWCAHQLPSWMAPNLITFIGWVFVIMSYANMLRYDYTFQKEIPSWCFFFAAFCIFFYMTLDAIDGKQARATKSSSPLGQLFDHGCDSFSLTFFILAIAQALKMPKEEVFILFVASQTSLWTANWMEYNTGVLKTKVGQFGVTESEFSCMGFHIVTGIFGQNVWQITMRSLIPGSIVSMIELPKEILDLRFGTVFLYGYGSLIFVMCLYSYASTIWASKGQRSKAMGEFLSLYLILIMEFVWINLKIWDKYVGIILVNFGVLTSLLTCKLIICSVTHMKFKYFHNELIVFLVTSTLMIIFDLRQDLDSMIYCFWFCFAINLLLTFKFVYGVIKQITGFLGIYCFSLEKKKVA